MKSLENNWQDPLNYDLLAAISQSTLNTDKYYPTPNRSDGQVLTTTWLNTALMATLRWVENSGPDEEGLRQALMTINREGERHGCSEDDFNLVTNNLLAYSQVSPSYHQILTAQQRLASDSLGQRHFGDAMVAIPHEFASSIPLGGKDKAWRIAYSNGCAIPRRYLDKIKSEGLKIPSQSYQSKIVPEIDHYFDTLPPSIQTFIWDYARANKLFQYVAEVISQENSDLFYELMHSREEMPDNNEAIYSLPKKVEGERQVRFMALSHPYPAISKFWKDFDQHCKNGNYELAEQEFDTNLTRLTNLAMRASTLAELERSYLSSDSA